jgi:hypothetical protein
MKAPHQIYCAGQSLWFDKITRDLLTSRTLKRYEELSATWMASPLTFDGDPWPAASMSLNSSGRLSAAFSGTGNPLHHRQERHV